VTVKVSADLEVADVMQDVTPEAALPTEVVTPEALLTEVEVDWPVRRLVMYMLVVVIVCQPECSFDGSFVLVAMEDPGVIQQHGRL